MGSGQITITPGLEQGEQTSSMDGGQTAERGIAHTPDSKRAACVNHPPKHRCAKDDTNYLV
jgi:hypothetical protein